MHRSGTSLFAKILMEFGVSLGDDLNEHHESIEMKQINDCLLREQGAHWANPKPYLANLQAQGFVQSEAQKLQKILEQSTAFGDIDPAKPWGWKDPRSTLTLPVWLSIFPEARVIHIVRNGIDVGMSLQRREPRRLFSRRDAEPMIPPLFTRGYRLWSEYLQTGLSLQTLCRHYLLVRYEDIIEAPRLQIDILCEFLDIDPSEEILSKIVSKTVGRPTQRLTLETAYLRLLFKLGMVDSAPLISVGYEPSVSP